MAYISLYSIPEMDATYEHVPWFYSLKEQQEWFSRRMKGSAEGKIHLDPTRTTVTIPLSYSALDSLNVDYCCIDDEEHRKKIYYFVTNFEYKASGTTTLVLQIDVIQTYITDLVFQDSFVDRCHVDRWKRNSKGDLIPTDNFQDEGLQFGDLITVDQEKIRYRDKYIITSTSPLGVASGGSGTGSVVPGLPPSLGGENGIPSIPPTQTADGDFKNGIVSAKLVRFIKPTEGFAPSPYLDKLAIPNVWTTGYGITQPSEPDVYRQLANASPAPEDMAAKALYNTLNKKYAAVIKKKVLAVGINKQQEFDAIVSFVYNLGTGYGDPDGSLAPTLWRKIKEYISGGRKNPQPVIDAFALYNKSGGVVHDGLVKRRRREAEMFCFGTYYKEPIGIVNTKGQTTSQTLTANGGNGWLPDSVSVPTEQPQNKPNGPAGGTHFNAYGYDFVYPANGTVTSTWYRSDGVTLHGALDVACPTGTQIHAARSGVVKYCQDDSPKGYGKWIQIDHPDIGLCTRYAHNSKLLVKIGQKVSQGEVIALSGNTGRSEGPHYHYELARIPYVNNKEARIKPIPHLKREDVIKVW